TSPAWPAWPSRTRPASPGYPPPPTPPNAPYRRWGGTGCRMCPAWPTPRPPTATRWTSDPRDRARDLDRPQVLSLRGLLGVVVTAEAWVAGAVVAGGDPAAPRSQRADLPAVARAGDARRPASPAPARRVRRLVLGRGLHLAGPGRPAGGGPHAVRDDR